MTGFPPWVGGLQPEGCTEISPGFWKNRNRISLVNSLRGRSRPVLPPTPLVDGADRARAQLVDVDDREGRWTTVQIRPPSKAAGREGEPEADPRAGRAGEAAAPTPPRGRRRRGAGPRSGARPRSPTVQGAAEASAASRRGPPTAPKSCAVRGRCGADRIPHLRPPKLEALQTAATVPIPPKPGVVA